MARGGFQARMGVVVMACAAAGVPRHAAPGCAASSSKPRASLPWSGRRLRSTSGWPSTTPTGRTSHHQSLGRLTPAERLANRTRLTLACPRLRGDVCERTARYCLGDGEAGSLATDASPGRRLPNVARRAGGPSYPQDPGGPPSREAAGPANPCRSHKETWVGCMVSCATLTRSAEITSRSTSLRRRPLNASMIRTAS